MSEIKPHIVELYGKRILLLNNFIAQGILPDPFIADVWLVNFENIGKVKKFLRRIARSPDRRVYLKPIYLEDNLRSFFGDNSRFIRCLSDGFLGDTDSLQIATLLDQVAYFMEKHGHLASEQKNREDQIMQHIVAYSYTRRSKIVPLRLTQSLTGYAFPRIDAFFFNKSDAYLNGHLLLQQAVVQGFLKETYFDTQHLCRNCNSGFLHYRELCPKCGGHDLNAVELIHHFRCAYVGPETDYAFQHKLVCPKCSVQLENRGVDYDKPGHIFFCTNNLCNHKFQEAPIQVSCVNCGTVQKSSELLVKKMYQYELTREGIQHFLFNKEKITSQYG